MSTRKRKFLELDWAENEFLSEKFSDCSIWVKTLDSCVRFPCHKYVLISVSDEFAEIFVRLAEKNESTILMEDVNPDAVLKVLEYAYHGRIEIDESITFISEVIKVAEKFKISKIIDYGESTLISMMNLQNVCYILKAAMANSIERVEQECISLCTNGGFIVLNTRAFQKSNLDIAKKIFALPNLQIKNEMAAFKVAWKWAAYRCCKENKILSERNIANEMNPLLGFIGFEFMSEEEILSIPKAVLQVFHHLFPERKLNLEKESLNSSSSLTEIANTNEATNTISISKQLLTAGRKIKFPLNLTRQEKTFNFNLMDEFDTNLNGNVVLAKFSVNKRLYLNAMCCNFRGMRMDYRDQNVKFNLCHKNGTLVTFCATVGCKRKYYSDEESIFSVFQASELLVFEKDEEYSVEVDVDQRYGNFKWQSACLGKARFIAVGSLRLSILSIDCFGISKLSFIEAF